MADTDETLSVEQRDRDVELVRRLRMLSEEYELNAAFVLLEAAARIQTRQSEASLLKEAVSVLRPLSECIDHLIENYGADRPDHQGQPLMLTMIEVKRIRAFLSRIQSTEGSENDG